jgi:Recombination endonuclease VII
VSKSHPTCVCTACGVERRINWHFRNQPDHQPGVYVCKYCKPRKNGPRYVNFDMATYRRSFNLMRRYGITAEEYDQMLADQGGVCAICKKPPVKNRLHVDHDRACCPRIGSCGKCIRGLLCSSCNSKVEWWLTYEDAIGAYVRPVA